MTRVAHPSRRTVGLALSVTAALTATSIATGSAAHGQAAGTYTLTSPAAVSTSDPLAACPPGDPTQYGFSNPNAEVEAAVATNPVHLNNAVGVVQQNPWTQGGSMGATSMATNDGGANWTAHLAALTGCSGATGAGAYTHETDPWVTFDADGNAYQSSMSCLCPQPTFAVQVSKSTDGGASWGTPTTLIRDDNDGRLDDKPSIAGDLTRPGYVYAVWTQDAYPAQDQRNARSEDESRAERGYPLFSRTTDSGAHWSKPRSVFAGNPNIGTIGNVLAVLPDGSLVDVFSGGAGSGTQPATNKDFIGVTVSHDAGQTWSRPTQIADFINLNNSFHNHIADPDNSGQVRAGTNIPSIAVDPRTGACYVVWADGRFSGGANPDVVISRSDDGGASWSTPTRVGGTPDGVAAFMPSVAVAADGTVGVSYYDLRNNTSAPGLPTDVWFAHSRDGGVTWAEDHVGGPFDMESAPVARGYWVGDYEGLAAAGNDFLFYFVMTTGDAGDPTDVFSVRAVPQ